jgi:hypothetical protein
MQKHVDLNAKDCVHLVWIVINIRQMVIQRQNSRLQVAPSPEDFGRFLPQFPRMLHNDIRKLLNLLQNLCPEPLQGPCPRDP